MELWLESCIVVLAVLVLLSCIRLHLAKKVALEIHAALPEKLNTDTNTPITLSCRDKDLCLLADTLNQSLEQLRAMQHCFEQGNAKNATSLGLSLHGHWWSRCTGRWMPLMKRGGLSSRGRFSLFFYKTDQK